MALRNELAHGVMQLAIIDGNMQILVRNANRALEPVRFYAHLSKEDFTAAVRSFAGLANRLRQIVEMKSA